MSSPAPAAGGAAPAGQADAGGGWGKTISRALLVYFVVNAGTAMLKQKLGPEETAPAQRSSGGAGDAVAAGADVAQSISGAGNQPALPLLQVMKNTTTQPLWKPQDKLDFYVFLSWSAAATHEDLSTQSSALVPGGAQDLPALDNLIDFAAYPSLSSEGDSAGHSAKFTVVQPQNQESFPILKAERVSLSDVRLAADVTLHAPKEVLLNNGSIWADVVAVPSGVDVRDPIGHARTRKMLTRLHPPRKNREGRRLLAGGSATPEEVAEEDVSAPANATNEEGKGLISYWHSNLTLAVPKQDAGSSLAIGQLPPALLQYIYLVPDHKHGAPLLHPRDSNGREVTSAVYNFPVVFPNTFWDMREDMYPINSTTPTLPLHISVDTTSWFKFQMLAALAESFDKQPGMAGGEIDIIKHTLLHTSPWYLILIVVVTILHMLFEFLAFSSEVSYWKKKDNLTGISVGTIMTSIVTQTIILLYLIDSSEETSWMILGSQAMGVAVESWKLTKALTVNIKPAPPGSLIPYRLDVQDKHVLSKEELETKEFDRVAFKIVAAGSAPLLIGYTIYSALYQTHRGWWSFTIGTLTSFVYTFGFVALIPQLIVNYKSKSVAGMNGKTLIYKIIGTFTDDLFAWGITKMPMMHRLATLRDDVVFFIYLYQWWHYGVDKSRVNEFGQVLEPTEEMKKRGGLVVGKKADLAEGEEESKKDK